MFNATNLLENPFITLLSVFMDFFEDITGNGMNFWIIPVVGVTLAIYVNNDYEPTAPFVFMILSGVLLSTGGIFAGVEGIPYALLIFSAIGLTGLLIDTYISNKR